jgi:hypothetical protein
MIKSESSPFPSPIEESILAILRYIQIQKQNPYEFISNAYFQINYI